MSASIILLVLFLYALLCLFGEKMWCFLRKLLNFFFPIKEESGEIFVAGKSSFSVNLVDHPEEIQVFFKDDCNLVPCNPSQDDLVWFFEDCGSCHHKLTIKWDVDGVRTIVWMVKY